MAVTLVEVLPWSRTEASAAELAPPVMPTGWASLPGVVASQGAGGTLPGSWNVSPGGAFNYTIPVDVPAGRAGMAPSLSVQYSSRGGGGLLGMGWSLSGASSSVTRCGNSLSTENKVTGVRFTAEDRFCLDGQKLIVSGGSDGIGSKYGANATEYRTETDSAARVVSKGSNAAGPDEFEVRSKDGQILTYTAVTDLRVSSDVFWDAAAFQNGATSPSLPRIVWLLKKRADRSGNEVRFDYDDAAASNGVELLPTRISYTFKGADDVSAPTRYVNLTYEDRPDTSFSFAGGVKYLQTKRLKTIGMFAPNPGATGLVWQYNFAYTVSSNNRSLLSSMAKCGPADREGAAGCVRAKTFTWETPPASPVPQFAASDLGNYPTITGQSRSPEMLVSDVNGDGADDAVITLGGTSDADAPNWAVLAKRDATSGAVTPLNDKLLLTNNMPDWPKNVSLPESRPFDLQADGRTELSARFTDATGTHDRVMRWDAVGQKYVSTGITVDKPKDTNFGDLDGDGRLDWLTADVNKPSEKDYSVRLNTGGTFANPVDSTFSTCVDGVRITDMDGDGKAEMVGPQQTAGNKCSSIVYAMHLDDAGKPTTDAVSYSDNQGRIHYRTLPTVSGRVPITGDFNGDGLEDYLLIPPSGSGAKGQMLWNTGNGLVVDPKPQGITQGEYLEMRVADMNGDGRDDLVSFGKTFTQVVISKGDGTWAWATVAPDGGTLDDTHGRGTSQVGDFNGDGKTDIVRIAKNHMMLLTNAGTQGDRLRTVGDVGAGLAAQTVVYDTNWTDHMESLSNFSCSYPTICTRRGITVVRRVDSRDHLSNPAEGAAPYSLYYAYEDPVTDIRGRGWLGFGTVRIWDPQRPIETIKTFAKHRERVEGKYYPFSAPDTVTTVVPILTQAQMGRTLPANAKARVTRVHYSDGWRHPQGIPGVYQVFGTTEVSKDWDQAVTLKWGSLVGSAATTHIGGVTEPDQAARRIDRMMNTDHFGNQIDRMTKTTGGVTETVHVDFDNRVADWLINLPVRSTVKREEPDNDPIAVTRTAEKHYDAKGRLDLTWVERNNPDLDLRRTTYVDYDQLGVARKTRVVAGDPAAPALTPRVTHTEYAPVFPGQPDEEIYPSQVWSEHDKTEHRPSTWTAIHPGYGTAVAVMDANGVQTTTTHDQLGRPTRISPQAATPTDLTYGNRVVQAGGLNGMIVTSTTGPIKTQTAIDTRGRTVKASSTGFDGVMHDAITSYDVLGRADSRSGPAPLGTSTVEYDSLDHVVKTTSPDGKVSTNEYPSMFATKSTDPTGAQTLGTVDVDGRMITSAQIDTSTNPASTITTKYEYGPFNLTSKITDDKGNQTRYRYDTVGRRIQTNDPDRGETIDSYYGTGDIRSETHSGTNNTATFGYDDLGRTVWKKTEDGTTNFVFDTAAHGIGRLHHADSPDKIRVTHRYDGNGRQTGTDYTDTDSASPDYNKTRSVDTSFDAAGRLATLSYPAFYNDPDKRYTVTTGYNANGHPVTLTDPANQQLWKVDSRLPNGALDTATLGHGGYGTGTMTMHNVYQANTGRTLHSTVTSGNDTLQHLTYSYLPNGQVDTKNDAVAGRAENYDYDPVGRLARWDLTTGGNLHTTTNGYDTLGNVTKVNGPTANETHTFGTTGGPHTLGTNDAAAGGGARHTFTYDAQGRRTDVKNADNNNVEQHTTYTSFDLPKTASVNGIATNYRYDAFGTKIVETSGADRTFYVPGAYEHRTKETNNGTVETDVYYLSGGIGQTTYNGQTLTTEYILTDGLGSTTTTVDSTGTPTNHTYYDPFGTLIAPGGTPTTFTGDVTHTFTGYEHDNATGLLNAGGRIYDPTNKVFLTPDPLIANPHDGLAFNPYSYVRNDPINNTDPTGYTWEDGHSPAFQGWWDSQGQSAFNEFVAAGEAYGEGGAAGLAAHQRGALRRAESEYFDHVQADEDYENEKRAASAAKAAQNNKVQKSDQDTNAEADDVAWEEANATAVNSEPAAEPIPGATGEARILECLDRDGDTSNCGSQTANPGNLFGQSAAIPSCADGQCKQSAPSDESAVAQIAAGAVAALLTVAILISAYTSRGRSLSQLRSVGPTASATVQQVGRAVGDFAKGMPSPHVSTALAVAETQLPAGGPSTVPGVPPMASAAISVAEAVTKVSKMPDIELGVGTGGASGAGPGRAPQAVIEFPRPELPAPRLEMSYPAGDRNYCDTAVATCR